MCAAGFEYFVHVLYLSVCLSVYLPICLPICFVYISRQPINLTIYLSIYRSIYISYVCLFCLSIQSTYRTLDLAFYPFVHPSFSIHLSFHLCIYLSICLSLCPFYLFLYSSIKMKHFRDTSCKKLKLKPRTRSNSARLPARMEVETVEMQKTYQASYKNAS